jgi:hypothetical protein
MNPETSKIRPLSSAYWGKQVANEFKDRINPGMTYSIYTKFESDEYTYFIGEEVKSLDKQDLSKFKSLIIPLVLIKNLSRTWKNACAESSSLN